MCFLFGGLYLCAIPVGLVLEVCCGQSIWSSLANSLMPSFSFFSFLGGKEENKWWGMD